MSFDPTVAPALSAQRPSMATSPSAAAADGAAPIKLLVVDDIESNLVAMRALLADTGLQVLTAASGPQALELLLQHEVALALLDVQMPGMDGYALAELMRGSERTRGVPIIFLTAGVQEARSSFRGYEAGAVDFLYKPLDERVLRSKIAVFVELHRQRLALAEHAAELSRLAQVNAMMLAALSHDLRAPLTALALNAEILRQRSDTPALAQVAVRQKAATAVLSHQIDHLLSLARLPGCELKVHARQMDLAQAARQRWQLHNDEGRVGETGSFTMEGDGEGWWDPGLIAAAIDQLMLQAETYADHQPLTVVVDGSALGSVVLRISFARYLPAGVAVHLFGSGMPASVLPPALGAGLREPERIARAHGGSLVGRTSAREGTCFELLLPRGAGA